MDKEQNQDLIETKGKDIAQSLGLNGLEALPHDASSRRYFRANEGILMLDLAEGKEERIANFMRIAARLRAQNLRAPLIFETNEAAGFALIEDFGVTSLKDAPTDPNLARAYELLTTLRNVEADGLKHYSKEIYQEEISRLWRFYLSAFDIEDDELAHLADAEFEALAAQSEVFVHLDYHPENLMMLADGEIGILDIQDARQGHRLYDLVSYFDGIRMDMPANLKQAAMGELNLNERHDFHVLSAQRLIKVIGIFGRLQSEGHDKYGMLLPQVFAQIDSHLEYDPLKLWREWFNDVVPRPTTETIKMLKAKNEQN